VSCAPQPTKLRLLILSSRSRALHVWEVEDSGLRCYCWAYGYGQTANASHIISQASSSPAISLREKESIW
jgi:hypothetical protein